MLLCCASVLLFAAAEDGASNAASSSASAASASASASSSSSSPPPQPQHQQQHNQQVVDALARGGPEALGVGLSITAALISFHVGALAALERMGVVDLARSPMAGGSGGAVVAFSSCVGLSIEETTGLVEDLSLYCSSRDSCAGMMDAPVRAANKRALQLAVAKARREGWPEAGGADGAAGGAPAAALSDAEIGDAIVRARCRGRVQFAVSELTRGLPRRERAEGQQAQQQGRRLEDGAANTTAAPAAAAAAKTADPAAVLAHPSIPLAQTAAALPWRPWLVSDYTGGEEAVDVASASAFISYFSGPSSALPFRGRRVADALFTVPLPCPAPSSAEADAAASSSSSSASLPCLRISAALPETSLLPGTPALTKPDIAPFLRVPMLQGVSARAWQRRALLAGDRAASRALARLGEMEAEAWAAEVGIVPAVAARPTEAGGVAAGGKGPASSLPAASALLPHGAAAADERRLTTTTIAAAAPTVPPARRLGPFVIGRAAAVATPNTSVGR
jgi:hypothetical protein